MDSSPASGPALFHCPTCGAALPVPDDKTSVRCQYCGSTVLVPAEYRQAKKQDIPEWQSPVVINMSTGTIGADVQRAPSAVARAITAVILLVVVCIVASTVLAGAGVFSISQMFGSAFQDLPGVVSTVQGLPTDNPMLEMLGTLEPLLTTPDAPGMPADIALQFGTKGAGAGQFDDVRHLAVDPNGDIFVADYQDGRVQKFDPSGKFIQLINVPPDDQGYITITDLAADYAGKLYVVRRGDILVFNTADGALLSTIPSKFPDLRYETVAIDPANNIYALHVMAGELDLIKHSPDGAIAWRRAQVTEGLYKKTEISSVDEFIVDGLGNAFLIDHSLMQVYHYDSEGKFVDRFGSKGDAPGQLDGPQDIAVDGQGRILVADYNGVHIFDSGGTYLKSIPDFYDGVIFDMKLDLQGNLWLLTNAPQIYKLVLKLD